MNKLEQKLGEKSTKTVYIICKKTVFLFFCKMISFLQKKAYFRVYKHNPFMPEPDKKHKNNNDAKGNYIIYAIWKNLVLWKYGKADAGQITKKPWNLPTRLHQQLRKLLEAGQRFSYDIIATLKNVTTQEAKELEKEKIAEYEKENGKKPEGNK
jgi:URI fold toxin 2